eukprot:TRINITY_DN408_c0_g4_i1.p1 TRINITY_DN408_c0_g4~~TRINITY_DN408_c0_g4_i1.p1  ORF type:complete len:934 (-),score=205.53 TRINITY_DN408_c0_g4_i1:369-3170(-)
MNGYRGAKAEEISNSNQSYRNNISNYLSGLSSYVPTALKGHLEWTTGTSGQLPLDDRDKIVWLAYDHLETGDETKRLCLVVAYQNGFQIWDVEDSSNIREIFSRREPGTVKYVKILPYVADSNEEHHHNLMEKQPLVAVIPTISSESQPPIARRVLLYSLKTHEYVRSFQFNTEVFAVVCNKRVFVVALRDQLFVFSLASLKQVENILTYPCPSTIGVLAVGPRWIAFPSKDPVLLPSSALAPNVLPANSSTIVDVAKDVAVDVAKEVASSLYYLGDYGRKTVTSYLYADSKTPANDEAAGTVLVVDYIKQKTIAHFRAHEQPISCLSFDPSGTLIATAAIDGYSFNIFQLTPTADARTSYRHLYALQRGVTSAEILHMCWSSDSMWLGVCSAHGTTHLFAVRPTGGPVSIYSHTNAQRYTEEHNAYDDELDDVYQGKPVQLNALARIKHPMMAEESTVKKTLAISAIFVRHLQTNAHRILIGKQAGSALLYELEPRGPPPATGKGNEVDPKTLFLNVNLLGEWGVIRKKEWPELKLGLDQLPRSRKSTEGLLDPEARWLSNVEICPNNPHFRPLWAGPQFVFKSFKKNPAEATKIATPKPEVVNVGNNPPVVTIVSSDISSNILLDRQPTYRQAPVYAATKSDPVVSSPAPDDLRDKITAAMSTPLAIKPKSGSDEERIYTNGRRDSWSSSPSAFDTEELLTDLIRKPVKKTTNTSGQFNPNGFRSNSSSANNSSNLTELLPSETSSKEAARAELNGLLHPASASSSSSANSSSTSPTAANPSPMLFYSKPFANGLPSSSSSSKPAPLVLPTMASVVSSYEEDDKSKRKEQEQEKEKEKEKPIERIVDRKGKGKEKDEESEEVPAEAHFELDFNAIGDGDNFVGDDVGENGTAELNDFGTPAYANGSSNHNSNPKLGKAAGKNKNKSRRKKV